MRKPANSEQMRHLQSGADNHVETKTDGLGYSEGTPSVWTRHIYLLQDSTLFPFNLERIESVIYICDPGFTWYQMGTKFSPQSFVSTLGGV